MKRAILLAACYGAARAACLVSGNVVDAESAKPLAHTRVFAKPPAVPGMPAKPAILRVTDNSGAFCFESLEPASYLLIAQHAGYLLATYGARPGQNEGTPFSVDGRTVHPPVTVKMVAGAAISGTVVDDRGQPLEETMVELQRKVWDGGWLSQHAAFTRSGAGGVFRMPMIPPGVYYLSADPPPLPFEGPGRENVRVFDEKGRPIVISSAMTYYPGSYTILHASPIAVKAGQEIGNIVLNLKPRVSRHVSGRIAAPINAAALANVAVSAKPAVDVPGPGGAGYSVSVRPDGSFTISDLGAFEYEVSVEGMAPMFATADLSNGDVDGLVLQPEHVTNLRVAARIEGQEAMPNTPLALCDIDRGLFPQSTPDAQGVYDFGSVRPGVYRFRSRSPEVYVKSLAVNGKPLGDAPLDLRKNAPENLVVSAVFGLHRATLEGHLEGWDSQASGLQVSVLLVDDLRFGPSVSNNFVAADTKGRFHFDGVTPSHFHVLAVEGFDDGPWGSPELLAALLGKSVAVALGDGEQKQVAVPVIPASEWEAALRKVGM